MELVLDHCPICTAKFTNETYKQVKVKLSNGTITRVAVCSYCLDKLTDKQLNEVFEAGKQWKIKYHENKGGLGKKELAEYKKKMANLKITSRI